MKYFQLILIFMLCSISAQDRSTIFNAGPPSTEEGFLLSNDGVNGTAIADRFYVANDYVLEAFYVWLKLVDSDSGSVNVKINLCH